MKKIIVPILLLMSFNSFSFEYKGVKSGMTLEEVKAATGVSIEKITPTSYKMDYSAAGTWLPNLKPELSNVYLRFDHNGKLYYLLIEIDAPDEPIKAMGYVEAAKEVCDEVTVKTSDDRGGVNCIFVDGILYRDTIKHYKEMQLKNLTT